MTYHAWWASKTNPLCIQVRIWCTSPLSSTWVVIHQADQSSNYFGVLKVIWTGNTPAAFVVAICDVKALKNILACFAIRALPGVDLPHMLWHPIFGMVAKNLFGLEHAHLSISDVDGQVWFNDLRIKQTAINQWDVEFTFYSCKCTCLPDGSVFAVTLCIGM